MFGKRKVTDTPDRHSMILGLMACLKPSDQSNLFAMKQLLEKEPHNDINFGTSREGGHGIFWLKLVSMGLAVEKPSGIDLEADYLKGADAGYIQNLKKLASFSPTKEGQQILLELLKVLYTGWPPKNSILIPECLQMLQKYAEEGNDDSQLKLALVYEKGICTEKNPELAFKWHSEAAKRGNAASMDSLGEMYFRGQGIKEDHKEALKWFRKAAFDAYRPAMLKLGHIYTHLNDHTRAYIWYSLSAKAGVNVAAERDKAAMALTTAQRNAADLFLKAWASFHVAPQQGAAST